MKPIQLRCPSCNRFLGTSKAPSIDVKLKCGNCGHYKRQRIRRLTLAASNTRSTERGKLMADSKPSRAVGPLTIRG